MYFREVRLLLQVGVHLKWKISSFNRKEWRRGGRRDDCRVIKRTEEKMRSGQGKGAISPSVLFPLSTADSLELSHFYSFIDSLRVNQEIWAGNQLARAQQAFCSLRQECSRWSQPQGSSVGLAAGVSLHHFPLSLEMHIWSCNLLCSGKAEGAQLDLSPTREKLLMPESALAGTDVTFVCVNDGDLDWSVRVCCWRSQFIPCKRNGATGTWCNRNHMKSPQPGFEAQACVSALRVAFSESLCVSHPNLRNEELGILREYSEAGQCLPKHRGNRA